MISKNLSMDFLGVHFENPFCLSSSPVGNCHEMCARAYDSGWGGVVFKTIGPKDFPIDEVSPRFDQLQMEDKPFIGFKNMEQIAEHPLEQNLDDLAKLKKDYPDKVLIASIMGPTAEHWTNLAKMVTEAGADMIEMNLSCPQMTSHAMGSDVGSSPELCEKYCQAVKKGSKLPLLAKMTPNITDMVPVAKACLAGGADGIAAINTVKSIVDIDLERKVGLPIVNGKSAISGFPARPSNLWPCALSSSCARAFPVCPSPALAALKPGRMRPSLFCLALPPCRLRLPSCNTATGLWKT